MCNPVVIEFNFNVSAFNFKTCPILGVKCVHKYDKVLKINNKM